MNYIKIKGKLELIKFMNSLANKLIKELNCKIEKFLKKLKFKAIFPNNIGEELEDEEGEKGEELENKEEEEGEKGEENENIKSNEFKDCVIKIELLSYINGGYEVHFTKGNGNFTDYYTHFHEIKKIIKLISKFKRKIY